MSATRLLVLGVTRMLQPVHGYVVRRELLTWNVETWANIKPGSIYGALRTLEKGGYIRQVETDREGGRPARTMYEVTDDGEAEFFGLFRSNLWRNIRTSDLAGFRAALSFMWVTTRDEVIQAMEHRIHQLEGAIKEQGYDRAQLRTIAEKPDHVAEMLYLEEAILQGQLDWTHAFVERLRAGEYQFVGEEGPDRPWHRHLAERGLV